MSLYFYTCFCLQIVQRYDILLIQEIRDISETAIDTLVDAVNTEIGRVQHFTCNTHISLTYRSFTHIQLVCRCLNNLNLKETNSYFLVILLSLLLCKT